MATIRIKRDIQTGINNLVLSEGEMAVALDTGNVYIGTTSGKVHINPPGGTADDAVKLKNSREFSITGDATSLAVGFDGTQNVSLALTLATMVGLTAGTYTKLTVDTKGRVTGATSISVTDLPSIPSTKITGLGNASTLNTGTAVGNIIVVGGDGKIPESLMPSITISDTFEAADESGMLALTAQTGDICIRSDESKSYILTASPSSTLANWKWLKTPDSKVLSVNSRTGAVTLTAVDVGAEPVLSGVAVKTTMVDADTLILQDSDVSGATKKITLLKIKEVLKTYFDTVYTLPTATASIKGGVKVGDGLAVISEVLSVGDIDGGTF